jgi:hypothetical protein
MSFAVKLAKPSPLPVSVSYATANGTASAGRDYSSASGRLVFAPGEKSKQVAVTIAGDTEFEPDETLTLVLSNPVNATLVRASATGTIKNEDVQKPNGGRYNGTTSQGRSVSFDVSSDLSIVSAISINIDISCPSIGYTDPNERLDLPMTLPLSPDWKFHYADSYSDSDASISIRLDGALSATGAATGSFRLDLGVNTEIGVVQCSTGDVTWTASPPA